MTDPVMVMIPVRPEVAELLRGDEARAAKVGQWLSDLVRTGALEDPLVQAIAELKREAHAAGLTDEIIDEELAAYNAERRHRRE